MTSNKGITLIQTILAVILLIVLTGFAIWYAGNTSAEAQLAKVYSEFSSVKEAYKSTTVLTELNNGKYKMEELLDATTVNELTSTYSEEDVGFVSKIGEADKLYILSPNNCKNIELSKIEYTYVIDETAEKIYLIGGFSRKDNQNLAYEYEEIEKLYESTLK